MPRRPRNPSGFVRKHSDTSSVRWQGIVKYPDPDKPGAWKQRSATFDRKAEAQAWVDAAAEEIDAIKVNGVTTTSPREHGHRDIP